MLDDVSRASRQYPLRLTGPSVGPATSAFSKGSQAVNRASLQYPDGTVSTHCGTQALRCAKGHNPPRCPL